MVILTNIGRISLFRMMIIRGLVMTFSVLHITTCTTAFVVVPLQQQQQHHSFHTITTTSRYTTPQRIQHSFPNIISNHGLSSRERGMMMHQQPHSTDPENRDWTTVMNPTIGGGDSASLLFRTTTVIVLTTLIFPNVALATADTDLGFIGGWSLSPTWNSALLAYGHYFFILLGTILLSYERFTVEANMSIEKEKSLVIADAMYGVVGALLAGTGYFRVISEYGKGWEYYAHEPLFWVKLSAAGLLAGLSLFPTITFIQRGSKLFQNQDIEPMSEALATRVQKVLNAELSAILSVPLMATLMARGVAYNPDFPWQIGAGFTVLTLMGSGAFYARQALTWTEPLE